MRSAAARRASRRVQQRQGEGRRLAGAGGGLPEHVAAGEQRRDRRHLDRRRLLVAEGREALEEARVEAEARETRCFGFRRTGTLRHGAEYQYGMWPPNATSPVGDYGRGASTTIVRVALSDLPPASVTVAVMVCVPGWRVSMPRLAPLPRGPSRSELHAMAGLRSASSGSVAVPVKTTVSPAAKVLSGAGAVM